MIKVESLRYKIVLFRTTLGVWDFISWFFGMLNWYNYLPNVYPTTLKALLSPLLVCYFFKLINKEYNV